MEDEQGNPANGDVPMDQLAGAPPPVQPPPPDIPISQLPPPTQPFEINNPVTGQPRGRVMPSPGAQTPTLTSHVGNTSVVQPINSGENLVQKTSGGTTVTRSRAGAEERGVERQIEEIDKAKEENARQAVEAGQRRAIEEAAAADQQAQIQADKAARITAAIDVGEQEIARREAIANDAEQTWKKAALDSTESRNTFWARQDTPYKLRAGVSLLLGLVGGLTDGSNVGAQRIHAAIEADAARFKDKLDMQEKILERSKGDVTAARQKILEQKQLIDIRSAAALDSVAAQAEARARRLGIDEAQIKGNAGILSLREAATEKKQKWLEGQRDKVMIESARTVSTGAGNGSGGIGKPPTEAQSRNAFLGKSMLDELDALGNGSALTSEVLARVQRQGNTVEAAEKTADKGIGGSLAVGAARKLGLIPKTKYEGLNAAQQQAANRIDNAVEKYARLLTGAGMPIEEQRRMMLQNAPQPGDTPEVVAEKLARLRAEANRMIALSGNAAAQVAGISRNSGATASNGTAPGIREVTLIDPATGRSRRALQREDGKIKWLE
jgi:hypothetical protein